MSRLALVGAILALVLGGALLGGVVGWRLAQNSRDAQLVGQVDAGRAQYAHAVDAGASAVAAALDQAAAITANAVTLDQEIHDVRHPLVVVPSAAAATGPTARCPAGAHPDGVRAAGVALVAPAAAQAASGAAPPLPGLPAGQDLAPVGDATRRTAAVDGDGDPVLNLGAVRLWNSALSGQPGSATLAGDTCPADDPAAPACAAGAGLTLRDAWSNHNVNASLCAADRSQLAELIGLLHQREAMSNQLQDTKP